MTMRYSIGGDDLIWLLRVAGENGSPHTLKEILADIQPIVEPVDVPADVVAQAYSPDSTMKIQNPGDYPGSSWGYGIPVPPAKPE